MTVLRRGAPLSLDASREDIPIAEFERGSPGSCLRFIRRLELPRFLSTCDLRLPSRPLRVDHVVALSAAQTNPTSSRAIATTALWAGLPRWTRAWKR